ncbi:unnamed protein product [Closterium sp. Naga37s-1]|nr:unnamed protein product [Closterium sp. Naga37s-1]
MARPVKQQIVAPSVPSRRSPVEKSVMVVVTDATVAAGVTVLIDPVFRAVALAPVDPVHYPLLQPATREISAAAACRPGGRCGEGEGRRAGSGGRTLWGRGKQGKGMAGQPAATTLATTASRDFASRDPTSSATASRDPRPTQSCPTRSTRSTRSARVLPVSCPCSARDSSRIAARDCARDYTRVLPVFCPCSARDPERDSARDSACDLARFAARSRAILTVHLLCSRDPVLLMLLVLLVLPCGPVLSHIARTSPCLPRARARAVCPCSLCFCSCSTRAVCSRACPTCTTRAVSARAAPFCPCYLVLLCCPRVPVLPPCSHAAPVLPRSALVLPRSACAAPLSPCCPVLPVLPRSARVLPRSGRVLPRSDRVAPFCPCPAPFCSCWPVLPVLPRSARLCPTRAVRIRWCPTRAVSSRSCPTRSVLPGLVLPVTPVRPVPYST